MIISINAETTAIIRSATSDDTLESEGTVTMIKEVFLTPRAITPNPGPASDHPAHGTHRSPVPAWRDAGPGPSAGHERPCSNTSSGQQKAFQVSVFP